LHDNFNQNLINNTKIFDKNNNNNNNKYNNKNNNNINYKNNDNSNDSNNNNDKEYLLQLSLDETKDQTYFLSNLKQKQLKKCLFPIGHLTKKNVRNLAQIFNLPTKNRKDSQGICFLGKLKYDDFLVHYLGEKKGNIKCVKTKKIIGKHRGLWFHTIGFFFF
jgi:tRNA U34 2-thiouridine synthase MnmA/TrmU